jgi:hypothetical protein
MQKQAPFSIIVIPKWLKKMGSGEVLTDGGFAR